MEPTKKVKITVTRSSCDIMKEGDVVYLNGPVLDPKMSAPVCVTALLAIYPWTMCARFGIKSNHMGWTDGYHVSCPDKLVDFAVTMLDE